MPRKIFPARRKRGLGFCSWAIDPQAARDAGRKEDREFNVTFQMMRSRGSQRCTSATATRIRRLRPTSALCAIDISKAYDWIMKARQAYPDDPESAKALGILSYCRENYPRSLKLLQEAKAKRPNDAELLWYLGQAAIAVKRKPK
jgi:hypothetical protein